MANFSFRATFSSMKLCVLPVSMSTITVLFPILPIIRIVLGEGAPAKACKDIPKSSACISPEITKAFLPSLLHLVGTDPLNRTCKSKGSSQSVRFEHCDYDSQFILEPTEKGSSKAVGPNLTRIASRNSSQLATGLESFNQQNHVCQSKRKTVAPSKSIH